MAESQGWGLCARTWGVGSLRKFQNQFVKKLLTFFAAENLENTSRPPTLAYLALTLKTLPCCCCCCSGAIYLDSASTCTSDVACYSLRLGACYINEAAWPHATACLSSRSGWTLLCVCTGHTTCIYAPVHESYIAHHTSHVLTGHTSHITRTHRSHITHYTYSQITHHNTTHHTYSQVTGIDLLCCC